MKYVQGQVRLATASPRVNEYDYGTNTYEPPDYYGRGDHFLYRDDPNLLPTNQRGLYMTESPYTPMPSIAYPPETLFTSHANPHGTGVYGNPDAPADGGGFDWIGAGKSALSWLASEEGQETVQQVKTVYDNAQGIGSGGSSSTSSSGMKIDGVPIGQVPVETLMEKLVKIENYLIPGTYSSSSEIPVIPGASLFGALYSNKYPQLKGLPYPVKMVVVRWNKIRTELQNRGAATPGVSGGSAESNEEKKKGSPLAVLAIPAALLLAKLLI